MGQSQSTGEMGRSGGLRISRKKELSFILTICLLEHDCYADTLFFYFTKVMPVVQRGSQKNHAYPVG